MGERRLPRPGRAAREAFAELAKRVGTTAEKIRAARREVLLAIARKGGMHPEQRAERLVRCAEITLSRFGGDLRRAVALPSREARRALRLFPGIGEPGAEKILLFTGTEPVLALESNGLRVLVRLGYGEQRKSYAATYRSVQGAVDRELVRDCAWLQRASPAAGARPAAVQVQPPRMRRVPAGGRLARSREPEIPTCANLPDPKAPASGDLRTPRSVRKCAIDRGGATASSPSRNERAPARARDSLDQDSLLDWHRREHDSRVKRSQRALSGKEVDCAGDLSSTPRGAVSRGSMPPS